MGGRTLDAIVELAGRMSSENRSALAHPVLEAQLRLIDDAARAALRAAATLEGTAASHGPGLVLEDEGEYWTLRHAGALCRLRDSRGLRMLARLVASPGRDIHAIDLVGGGVGVESGDSDAGEHLDARALAGYRERLAELRAHAAEAHDAADLGRQRLAHEEIAALERELARALGLGGRARRAGGLAERARVNARRRLADTIRRARSAVPSLGAHLGECVVTGTFCSYDPRRARPHV